MRFFPLIVLLFPLSILANTAMPGFFDLGGQGDYQLFYPNEKAYMDKIRMEKERITVLLYSGYAVVKGEYAMRSLADSALRLHVGYPVNTLHEYKGYRAQDSGKPDYDYYQVLMDSLYGLRVQINGNSTPSSLLSEKEFNKESHMLNAKNWHVWEMDFTPGLITKITVYFIVKTGDAYVREGYNKDDDNGFCYLLETGRSWAGTIGEGEVILRMMDGLDNDDVMGIYPESSFYSQTNKHFLRYDFEELEPDFYSNVVVRYRHNSDQKNNIHEIIPNINALYKTADESVEMMSDMSESTIFSRTDMSETRASAGGFFVLFLLSSIIWAPALILLLVLWLAWRWWKRRRK